MIKKVLLAVVAILAVSAFLTVKEKGVDEAFGGAFAPVDSARIDEDARDSALDALVTGQSIPSPSQSNYGQLLDRMQDSLDDAVDRSVERASQY